MEKEYGWTDENTEVKEMKKKTWTFNVAGVQHHQLKTCIHDLTDGQELTLVPEPTNKYDANAIRIQHGDTMLGYVPAKISPEVTAEMTIFDNIKCFINKVSPGAKPWEQLNVTVGQIEGVEVANKTTEE